MAKSKLEEYKRKLQVIVDSIAQDPSVHKETKAQLIIHATSLACAIVAIQPLPFADALLLTPIQLVMVTALNRIMGNPFEKSSLKEIITSLLGVVGWGTLAQHTILGLYKTFVPFLGGLTTIPLVYAATFALGMGAKTLIEARKSDQTISDEELRKVMEHAKKEAQESQKKLSVSEAIEQIEQLLKDANKYVAYKEKLLKVERIIRMQFSGDVAASLDVNSLIQQRKQIIAERISGKYKNIKIGDYILSMLAVLDSKLFIEVVEPLISQICFDMSKMNCVASNAYRKGRFFEIETEIGVFVVKRQKKNEIVLIDFSEEVKKDSILKYIHPENDGRWEVKKDGEIGECFHEIIRSAKDYVYIVSPWVGDAPYNTVSNLLSEAAERNEDFEIKVLFGYRDGKGSSGKKNEPQYSRRVVDRYKRKIGAPFHSKETNTHVKLVICDDKCFLLGSMNYLSFLGDYSRVTGDQLRHEVAMLSQDTELLQELKEAYFSWE